MGTQFTNAWLIVKSRLKKINMGLLVAWILVAWISSGASAHPLPEVEDAEIARLSMSGGIVVINFWATWCAPCRAEIPALNRLHDRYPAVRFVGINLDDPENEGAIPGFLKKYPIQYEKLRRIGSHFDVTTSAMDPDWKGGIPATFIFQNGHRIFSKIGEIDEKQMESALENAGKQP